MPKDLAAAGHGGLVKTLKAKAFGAEALSSGKTDLLLRFFESHFFDEWIALQYLFCNTQPGVHDYLCNKLYDLQESALEKYLLQLVYLAFSKPGQLLERTIIDLCSKSFRIAVKVQWLLLALTQDNAKNKQVEDFRRKCYNAALEGKWEVPFRNPRLDPLSPRSSLMMQHANSTSGNPLSPGSSVFVSSPPNGSAIQPPFSMVMSPPRGLSPLMQAAAGETAQASSLGLGLTFGCLLPATAAADTEGAIMPISIGMPTGSPHASHMAVLPATPPSHKALLSNNSKPSPHPATPGTMLDAIGADSMLAHSQGSKQATWPGYHATHAKETDRIQRLKAELGEGEGVTALLERSKAHGQGGVVAVSCAEDEGIMSDDEFSDRPMSPLSRIRYDTFSASLDFIEALCDASSSLVCIPAEERPRALRHALDAINRDLEAASRRSVAVWFPMGPRNDRVLRLAAKESVLLNSRDKAPFMLFVEVLEGESDTPEAGSTDTPRGTTLQQTPLKYPSTSPVTAPAAIAAAASGRQPFGCLPDDGEVTRSETMDGCSHASECVSLPGTATATCDESSGANTPGISPTMSGTGTHSSPRASTADGHVQAGAAAGASGGSGSRGSGMGAAAGLTCSSSAQLRQQALAAATAVALTPLQPAGILQGMQRMLAVGEGAQNPLPSVGSSESVKLSQLEASGGSNRSTGSPFLVGAPMIIPTRSTSTTNVAAIAAAAMAASNCSGPASIGSNSAGHLVLESRLSHRISLSGDAEQLPPLPAHPLQPPAQAQLQLRLSQPCAVQLDLPHDLSREATESQPEQSPPMRMLGSLSPISAAQEAAAVSLPSMSAASARLPAGHWSQAREGSLGGLAGASSLLRRVLGDRDKEKPEKEKEEKKEESRAALSLAPLASLLGRDKDSAARAPGGLQRASASGGGSSGFSVARSLCFSGDERAAQAQAQGAGSSMGGAGGNGLSLSSFGSVVDAARAAVLSPPRQRGAADAQLLQAQPGESRAISTTRLLAAKIGLTALSMGGSSSASQQQQQVASTGQGAVPSMSAALSASAGVGVASATKGERPMGHGCSGGGRELTEEEMQELMAAGCLSPPNAPKQDSVLSVKMAGYMASLRGDAPLVRVRIRVLPEQPPATPSAATQPANDGITYSEGASAQSGGGAVSGSNAAGHAPSLASQSIALPASGSGLWQHPPQQRSSAPAAATAYAASNSSSAPQAPAIATGSAAASDSASDLSTSSSGFSLRKAAPESSNSAESKTMSLLSRFGLCRRPAIDDFGSASSTSAGAAANAAAAAARAAAQLYSGPKLVQLILEPTQIVNLTIPSPYRKSRRTPSSEAIEAIAGKYKVLHIPPPFELGPPLAPPPYRDLPDTIPEDPVPVPAHPPRAGGSLTGHSAFARQHHNQQHFAHLGESGLLLGGHANVGGLHGQGNSGLLTPNGGISPQPSMPGPAPEQQGNAEVWINPSDVAIPSFSPQEPWQQSQQQQQQQQQGEGHLHPDDMGIELRTLPPVAIKLAQQQQQQQEEENGGAMSQGTAVAETDGGELSRQPVGDNVHEVPLAIASYDGQPRHIVRALAPAPLQLANGGMTSSTSGSAHSLAWVASAVQQVQATAMTTQQGTANSSSTFYPFTAPASASAAAANALRGQAITSTSNVSAGSSTTTTLLPPEVEKRRRDAGAVYGERWSAKEARIKQESPHGRRKHWALRCVIVKSGDDCRQELMAVQLIRTFADVFTEAGLPLWVRTYEVLVTSNRTALIELVPDTLSLHTAKQRHLPAGSSLSDHFFAKFVRGTPECQAAQRRFTESMAAYSLICYLLQIKDRHNGNILISDEGHIVHIDFGFMLSNSPGGVNFESAPFKLTRELLEVMDSNSEGRPSELFDYFKVLTIQGFLAVRKHHERLLLLVKMMARSGFPCFKAGDRAVKALEKRFQLTLTEVACVQHVLGLISDSLDAWRTRQYDYYQRVLNGIL